MKTCGLSLVLLASLASPVFAQTFNVTSTRDAPDAMLDGTCATLSLPSEPPACTLRAAIQEAHHSRRFRSVPRINLPAGVYPLSYSEEFPGVEETGQRLGAFPFARALRSGDIDIMISIEIVGAGAGLTVIDGSGLDRVFDFWPNDVLDSYLRDFTVRNGHTTQQGGCMFNRGFHTGLWMNSVHFEGCVADIVGGGLANLGAVIMERPAFRGNRAVLGGGLYNGFIAQINEATFDGNGAGPGLGLLGSGGAIANYSGTGGAPELTVRNSTLSNNSATIGGAVLNRGSASFRNSTLSGNIGGQVSAILSLPPFVEGSTSLGLGSSTITGNRTTDPTSSGAIRVEKGTLFGLGGSIISNNRDDDDLVVNCDTPVTSSSESIEDSNSCGLAGMGDQINTEPMLGPLSDNGGPTLTHALLPESPAIDANPAPFESRDQRGRDRPFGAAADVGAFERGIEFAGEIIRIPFEWDDLFTSGLLDPITFEMTMSLRTPGKPGNSFGDAELIGVKGSDAQVKYQIDATGTKLILSGLVVPPKKGAKSNPVLFYLDVQRGLTTPASLRAQASCACNATPAKPIKYRIAPSKPGKQP